VASCRLRVRRHNSPKPRSQKGISWSEALEGRSCRLIECRLRNSGTSSWPVTSRTTCADPTVFQTFIRLMGPRMKPSSHCCCETAQESSTLRVTSYTADRHLIPYFLGEDTAKRPLMACLQDPQTGPAQQDCGRRRNISRKPLARLGLPDRTHVATAGAFAHCLTSQDPYLVRENAAWGHWVNWARLYAGIQASLIELLARTPASSRKKSIVQVPSRRQRCQARPRNPIAGFRWYADDGMWPRPPTQLWRIDLAGKRLKSWNAIGRAVLFHPRSERSGRRHPRPDDGWVGWPGSSTHRTSPWSRPLMVRLPVNPSFWPKPCKGKHKTRPASGSLSP